jgi:hypothetical protein
VSGREDLVITIEPDTSPFEEALAQAVTRVLAVYWPVYLASQRRRSRLVTRRKQRRSW